VENARAAGMPATIGQKATTDNAMNILDEVKKSLTSGFDAVAASNEESPASIELGRLLRRSFTYT
jgi:hypothetical protein